MKEIRWLSIRRLKNREFRKTLRRLRKNSEESLIIYLRLGELFKAATNKAGKQLLAIFSLYLAIKSLSKDGAVELTIGNITASVPMAYATFVSSLMMFLFIYQLQTVISLMELKLSEGNSLNQKDFSAEVFSLYQGQEELFLSTPFYKDTFFFDKYGFSRALTLIVILVIILTLVPVIVIWWYFFVIQIGIIQNSNSDTLQIFLSSLGLIVMILSPIFFAMMNLPIPFHKNTYGIRWGLLARLRGNEIYPLGEKWIKDLKNN